MHDEVPDLQVGEGGQRTPPRTATRLAPAPEQRVPAEDGDAAIGIGEALFHLARNRVETGRQRRVDPLGLPHLAVDLPECVDRAPRLPDGRTGDEDRETVLHEGIQPSGSLPEGVGEGHDRGSGHGLPFFPEGELHVGRRRLRVVEVGDESFDALGKVLLGLFAPDLHTVGEQPARGDGVEAEQEPVQAGDAHAAACLFGEAIVRGRESGEIPFARGEDRDGLQLAHDALGRQGDRADALDLIPPPFHPDGRAAGTREDVDDTAAHRELAGPRGPVHPLVAEDDQSLERRVEL